MGKNEAVSSLDVRQMQARMYDEPNDAQRVVIIGDKNITFESKAQDIKTIEVPVIVKEIEIREIEKPVIVKETVIERVLVPPQIITEYKTIEIEKPIYIEVSKTIEVPVIIKEKELEKIPTYIKLCFILQSLAILGLFVTMVLKK